MGPIPTEHQPFEGVPDDEPFGSSLHVLSPMPMPTKGLAWLSLLGSSVVQEFISSIREGRPPEVPGNEGLRDLE